MQNFDAYGAEQVGLAHIPKPQNDAVLVGSTLTRRSGANDRTTAGAGFRRLCRSLQDGLWSGVGGHAP